MKTAIFARRACAFGLSAALVLACAPVYAFADDATTTPVDTTPAAAATYNQADAQTLTNNLAKRFMAGGTDASITNDTYTAAWALGASGLSGSVDKATLQKNLADASAGEYFTAGTYAKYIIALYAAGATQEELEGYTENMEALLGVDSTDGVKNTSVYSLPYILMAYSTSGVGRATHIKAAVETLLACQADDGLFGSEWGTDAQVTAQAVQALVGYTNYTGVSAAIEKACTAIIANQSSDGSILYYGSANLPATTDAIVALYAAGSDTYADAIDAAVGYVVSCASEDLSGVAKNPGYDAADSYSYEYVGGVYSEPSAAAGMLQALVAAGITPKGIATQTIKVSPASRTVQYTKAKKAKQSVSFKVKGAEGKLVTEAVGTKAQKALRVKANDNKVAVIVKKGAKKGTYKVNVYAKASGAYKKSATKTLKVVVK